jgi:hypothetical protein
MRLCRVTSVTVGESCRLCSVTSYEDHEASTLGLGSMRPVLKDRKDMGSMRPVLKDREDMRPVLKDRKDMGSMRPVLCNCWSSSLAGDQ